MTRACTLAGLVRLAGRWSGHPLGLAATPVALAWPMAAGGWRGRAMLSQDNCSRWRSRRRQRIVPTHLVLGITPTPLGLNWPGAMLGQRRSGARLNRWRAAVTLGRDGGW